MLSNNTYIPLKEKVKYKLKYKKKLKITNSISHNKHKKSQQIRKYIKESNINPLLKIIYLYF